MVINILDDDFFSSNTEEEAPQAPEKIKIGDEEYSPEDAKALLDLGKIGKEAQDKYNTDLSKVWPEYTKSRQELAEFRKAKEDSERQALEAKQQSGADLSPEERAKVGRQALKEFGVMFDDEYQSRFDNDYASRRQAEKLLDTVNNTVDEAKSKYGIDTNAQKLLSFMQADGEVDAKKALSKLYEPRIKAWEDAQLQDNKPQGLVTEAASTAGAKQPGRPVVTKDNLFDMVSEVINRG